jgi:HTH-type transcriptional regulator/antitoxin HigA
MNDDKSDINNLLSRLFEPEPAKVEETLEELFLQRIESLSISKTMALKTMNMASRTLDGILSGSQKKLDYTQLIKLSNFLGRDIEEVAVLYIKNLKSIHETVSDVNSKSERISFINEKFNLAELKKIGVIESLNDYDNIENSICKYFGLDDIFDYEDPEMNIAFSSGKRARKNCSIKNWMFKARKLCIELQNTNKYNREELINYFPQIRWQSKDVENGLINVIQHLYQIGITVVFIPSFPSLHIRGATFVVNNKPCIAIADYMGFYPTLWFALVHELYHVLFDFEEIYSNSEYHISQEEQKSLGTKSQGEIDADNFARQYFFSEEKMLDVQFNINNQRYISEYASLNDIDPSFIYVFYAFDSPKADKYSWGRARKFNPNIEPIKDRLQYNHRACSFNKYVKTIRNSIYN